MVVDKNELERELVSIDENLVRKDLSKLEIESHLRRAKEIYQELNPVEEIVTPTEQESVEATDAKKEVLPAEKFLNMVSEKTGLSPKQIHEAINRDEMAATVVKEARRNGELSLSQTNEIVKLKKEEQEIAIEHIKELPVRDIKKFVKIAKTHGVEEAIEKTPNDPLLNEFNDINSNLKKLVKKMKQLSLEGIEFSTFPAETQKLFSQLMELTGENHYAHSSNDDYSSHASLS
jgi:ParB family chromosome partitioning protein